MKGIDVAKWQGNIDWNKVKKDGCEFAILKIINKSGKVEESFETNYKGCQAVGMPIGVYNYSYAKTVADARNEANAVLKVLNGRKAVAGIWWDVEDSVCKGLKTTLIQMIDTYRDIIEKAGYSFGVYTGLSFFNTYIKPYNVNKDIRFWIARYPSTVQSTLRSEPPVNKKPDISNPLWAWQFSSTGKVEGIPALTDLNKVYGEVNPKTVHENYIEKKSDNEIAAEVINGKWGAGEDRKKRLTQAGYDYAKIQSIVNQLIKKGRDMIGHASIDENGKAQGGMAGDQTGKEVCRREWYKKPWTAVIRPNDSNIAEKIAKAMEEACDNNNIGYDQSQRTTLFTEAQKVGFRLSTIKTKCETDCSALVAVCVNAAGVKVSKDIYTGNELNALKATGEFKIYTTADYVNSKDKLKRGDILLAKGHTAIVL